MRLEEELEQLRQEKQALREVNQSLRECVLESIRAIENQQKRVKELEGVITSKPGTHQNPGREAHER